MILEDIVAAHQAFVDKTKIRNGVVMGAAAAVIKGEAVATDTVTIAVSRVLHGVIAATAGVTNDNGLLTGFVDGVTVQAATLNQLANAAIDSATGIPISQ